MNSARKALFACIISILSLSACQNTKPLQGLEPRSPLLKTEAQETASQDAANAQKPSQSPPTAKQNVIRSWTTQGVMAVRHPKKSWTASFNWSQHGPESYHIRLFGPLGSGTVLIDRQNGVTTYQDGPKKLSSKNANALLRQQTGVALPVYNLYYWARGIPAPGQVSATQKGPGGSYASFVQSGYKVEYPEYIRIGDAILPRQIKLTGHNTFIKVIIKSWRF